jgi:hypothetical protein
MSQELDKYNRTRVAYFIVFRHRIVRCNAMPGYISGAATILSPRLDTYGHHPMQCGLSILLCTRFLRTDVLPSQPRIPAVMFKRWRIIQVVQFALVGKGLSSNFS